jgi:hypothetical protein
MNKFRDRNANYQLVAQELLYILQESSGASTTGKSGSRADIDWQSC